MKIIIDIDKDNFEWNKECCPDLTDLMNIHQQLINATPIPDDATNGDVIKAMFPYLDAEIECSYITCWIDERRWLGVNLDWWNAPYKNDKE